MDNLDRYDRLVSLLTEPIEIDGKKYLLSEEFEKFFISNNKSAGIRIRKIMQKIRIESKEIRKAIQEHKKRV